MITTCVVITRCPDTVTILTNTGAPRASLAARLRELDVAGLVQGKGWITPQIR